MKLLIAASLVFTSVAFAKATPMSGMSGTKMTIANTKTSTNANTSKFDVRVPVKNWFKKNNDNFKIGIAQGSLTGNVRQRAIGFDDSVNESRNTKLQIQFGWETIKTKEVGYNVFFTYQDIAEAWQKEDVRSMRTSGNVTYGLNDQAYTYGGLNWNKYYGSEQIEAGIDAGMGYQVGVGFKFHKRANVELEYLTLINEGRVNGANIDIENKGLLIKLNTPFTFNI